MSPSDASCRRMTLTWGVTPLHLAWARSTDELVWIAVEAATREGIVRAGDVVAVLAGDPSTGDKVVDVLRLVRVH
jgi:pyruvate kinase